MNLRDLHYLVALADLGHFGKAAEASHISQPTLSMQLKKLESYLDVQLIERQPKQTMLTPIGKDIAERARRILKDVEDLRDAAKTARDPYSGDFHFGIFPTLAPYLLPRITPSIQQHFPKLKMFLIEEKTDALIEQLHSGTLDVALLALPIHSSRLDSLALFDDPFVLAVAKQHPFAQRQTVSLSDLRHSPLLLLEEGHCLRSQALEVCNLTGASEYENFRATSLETLRQMVAANMGMTLIPQLAINDDPHIAYIPFTHPAPSRHIGMVFRKSSAKKPCIDTLSQLIKKLCTDS